MLLLLLPTKVRMTCEVEVKLIPLRNSIETFISVIILLDAQTFCFTISLYMFRAHVLIIRRSKLHYTVSGIITPIGLVEIKILSYIEYKSAGLYNYGEWGGAPKLGNCLLFNYVCGFFIGLFFLAD